MMKLDKSQPNENTDLALVEKPSDNLPKKESRTTAKWEHQDLAQVKIKVLRGHEDAVKSCEFCGREHERLLTASWDKSIIMWHFETGDSLHIYEGGHDKYVSEARANSNATRFVSGGWDKRVNVWDTDTGKVLWSGYHGGIVTSCNFSHDGQYVVSASDLDNIVRIWDANTGEIVHEIKDLHKSTITSVQFSPSDDRIVTTSMDRSTKFYDLKTQTNTISLQNHINVVSGACFTSDERKFATVSYDKAINIYDVSTGTYRSQGPTAMDKAHEGCISCVDYSVDGLLLATGSFDSMVSIWDVENRIQKLKLQGHQDWVEDVSFRKDQMWLMSCSKDKTVRLWNIENADEIPMVMEKKKAIGMKVFKCAKCGKPFSISDEESEEFIQHCVFCRMEASRANLD